MPVNLNRVVSSGHDLVVENWDLHHRNDGPYPNVKQTMIAAAQEGHTPEQRTQDLGYIYSRVGRHVWFGNASHVHIPSVEAGYQL